MSKISQGMESSKVKLNAEERQRIFDVFNDPIKILLIFKIIKKPKITPNELKESVNIQGTKIYYYLDDLEGLEKTIKGKQQNKIPLINSEEEKAIKNLIQKRYSISPWLQNVLENNSYAELFDTEEENLKWKYLFWLNVSIALMTQHKREIELMDSQEFKPNSNLYDIIQYNNMMFVSKENFDKLKPNFKKLYENICDIQNETMNTLMSNLLSAVNLGSHAFVLGAMSW